MKKKLWICDFQHTTDIGISCKCTCVEAETISLALEASLKRIADYMEEGRRMVITNIGLGDECSREYLGKVYNDPLMEPDPELFYCK